MRKIFLLFAAITSLSLIVKAQETSPIKWYTLEEALELNAKQPKKIFIDIYTDWCGWCKTMDKNTFSNPYIAKYLSENFYPVKFNAEGTGDITYKGQVFKNRNQGQRSTHDFAIALLQGKLSYPSVAFLDSTSTPITFLAGYQTPEQFEPILVFISEGRYKTEKWDVFQSKFVSKLPK
jgi:thioredoxin-related protein